MKFHSAFRSQAGNTAPNLVPQNFCSSPFTTANGTYNSIDVTDKLMRVYFFMSNVSDYK